ncbi:gfo/Idh/MocA family oxidoreductase [Gammaproteobacteria bacterium]|nr:gfo/Idh/MocA family oxidoreductase [Gammaproteobacteria bacterium]
MNTAQLHKETDIILVGSSQISEDYLKVLLSFGMQPTVVCRKETSAIQFYDNTGYKVQHGDLTTILSRKESTFDMAIVAVDIENLKTVSEILLLSGIKKLLIEKPGGISAEEINSLDNIANLNQAELLIAYNRRFYSSVLKAKEIIESDGGVSSFHFEFTEWSHVIDSFKKPKKIKERWFFSNSTHVVDLAFFLGGKPKNITCYNAGAGNLKWHSSSSAFSGAGVTYNNALFSYHADWTAPGRWKVEILTKSNRIILEPLEELQIQKIGSVEKKFVEIKNEKDLSFKPGLFNQVKAFLNNDLENFCTIREQKELMKVYNEISNYNN